MKRLNYLQMFLSLMLVFAILSPVATLAAAGDNGKKHFQAGMNFEASEDWDKAAEEFALAASQNPKNPEYKLHLARALFNASQMYIKKGTLAAKEKDFPNAYIFFRKAYAFDPTNELAHTEMDRMVRLQQEATGSPVTDKDGSLKVEKSVYTGTTKPVAPVPQIPQKLEKLRDLPFPNGVDLQFIIKELARDLDLNVLFDQTSFRQPRKTTIDLKNVTAAFALDCIFLQEGLFFQKVGPRTILIANSEQRSKFQQVVLRTFYLANASPKDIAKVVQTAIPAQPGRGQTIVLTDDATNSVTIRDTAENIRLIGDLIASLDKDRAEVVMDVSIYEVNKNDLLQFGNQIGTAGATSNLTNLGGIGLPTLLSGSTQAITQGMQFLGTFPGSIAFGLPISNFTALQTRSNTKLIASTQIHAFNNEDSSARIGQRVPVRSATIAGGGIGGTTTNNGNSGFVSDVINYEQVGLTLKFKPLVFPNQDVQVAMEIESKDVAGAQTLTPTFTERTIKGTARIQNNKTLLLASVAQGNQSEGRTGLPLLGLIPILGRLFTAPTKSNSQIDIVIAVTPRVIRAPAILPSDEVERPSGSMAVPTSSSLEAMIIQEEQDEMLALARKNPTNVDIQLPDQKTEAPAYVKTSGTDASVVSQNTAVEGPALKPIDSGTATLQLNQTSNVVKPAASFVTNDTSTASAAMPTTAVAAADIAFQEIPEMKAGMRAKVAVMISGGSPFQSAVLGLKFDNKNVAIRSVSLGNAFGSSENALMTPFLNQNGKMFVSLSSKGGALASGTLAYIEIEALTDGRPAMAFEGDALNFVTADGKNLAVKYLY
ncbi:MAG: secretin N-terminal domain-containing protein [Acidobacteriota bacterium]